MMREKVLIILYGLFCLFSENALSAAALSAPEFHETEEYKRWTKLRQGVGMYTAPFNLPPFFTTMEETRNLVNSVGDLLEALSLGASSAKIKLKVLSLVDGYERREPNKTIIIKGGPGHAEEVYVPETFSVPSKMDIFPTRPNVGREDIYRVVIGIVRKLSEVLTVS